MKKNLIIYYSRKGQNYVNGSIKHLSKGNTEICAELIQKAVGGDLFEIETTNEYSTDYMGHIEEAKKELQQNARPELKHLKVICKGATFGSGLAVHGADAAKSEQTVARWAKAYV